MLLPLRLAGTPRAWHIEARCVNKFRVWIESLYTFGLEVISGERRDFKAKSMRAILFGSSKLYQVVVEIHRWLINVRVLRDKTLGVQVIAIGNLTVGGTGKTPVVEKFARELCDAGRNVAILSRGYRSKPQPLHLLLLNKILLREDQHAAARRLGRQIAPARFRNGRRRAVYARV